MPAVMEVASWSVTFLNSLSWPLMLAWHAGQLRGGGRHLADDLGDGLACLVP